MHGAHSADRVRNPAAARPTVRHFLTGIHLRMLSRGVWTQPGLHGLQTPRLTSRRMHGESYTMPAMRTVSVVLLMAGLVLAHSPQANISGPFAIRKVHPLWARRSPTSPR